MNATYEKLAADAQEKSKGGRYAAVVEIVTYRTGTSRVTISHGTHPIKTRQVGAEFIGVMSQFYNGNPYPS